jgi:hypothetical protein
MNNSPAATEEGSDRAEALPFAVQPRGLGALMRAQRVLAAGMDAALLRMPESAAANGGFRYSSAIFYGFTPAPTNVPGRTGDNGNVRRPNGLPNSAAL